MILITKCVCVCVCACVCVFLSPSGHHARYQPPQQNRLGIVWEVLHRALREAKRAIKAQGSVAEGGGHEGSAVRVHDVGSA